MLLLLFCVTMPIMSDLCKDAVMIIKELIYLDKDLLTKFSAMQRL